MKTVLLALDWLSTDIIRGVMEVGRQRDWHLILHPNVSEKVSFKGWKGDGILTGGPRFVEQSRTANSGVSIVSVSYPEHDASPSRIQVVREDDRAIGALAAEHFLERGYRHFVAFSWHPGQIRPASFKDALAAAGHGCEIVFHCSGNTYESLYRSLEGLDEPCAVFCENDFLARIVIDASLQNDVNVPGDLAVLGVNNDSLICDTARVPISSIENRLTETGRVAARVLDDLMMGKRSVGVPVLVKPSDEVVVRQSTDQYAISNKTLGQAIDYIRKHHAERIMIADLARQLFLSESALYKLFRRNLNVSPKGFLQGERTRHAALLLRTSDLTCEVIASMVGFPTTASLFTAFRKRFDSTPNEYRTMRR